MQKVYTSANTETDSQAAAACNVVALHSAAAEVQKPLIFPALYSASHAVSKLAKSPFLLQSLDLIRDTPVREQQGASQNSLRHVQNALYVLLCSLQQHSSVVA